MQLSTEKNVDSIKLVLASNSPRRQELLIREGVEFVVDAADIDEKTDKVIPYEVVMDLSLQKARAVSANHLGKIILAADTIVAVDDKILGKPKDESDALVMLKSLSGRKHQVYTGVSIIFGDGSVDTFYECTDVEMVESTEKELLEYIATGEPMDKAGSYAIQGIGGKFVKGIIGDYDNVVGLPVKSVLEHLEKAFR